MTAHCLRLWRTACARQDMTPFIPANTAWKLRRTRRFLRGLRRERRTLLSADTDFATLLALREETKPSVILLRRGPKQPDLQVQLLVANLPAIAELAEQGSIIVIEETRMRGSAAAYRGWGVRHDDLLFPGDFLIASNKTTKARRH